MNTKCLINVPENLWFTFEPVEKLYITYSTDEYLNSSNAHEYVRTISWSWGNIFYISSSTASIYLNKTHTLTRKHLQKQNKSYLIWNRTTVPLRI